MEKEMDQAIAEGMLFTDQYQLTMAQLYFRMGLHERPSYFEHFFRRYPSYGEHQAGYCVAAGLGPLLEWMGQTRVGDAEVEALRAQRGRSGERLFADDFLGWLREHGSFEALTLRAIPEGRVAHQHVPLSTVEGPLALAQLLETALLNQLNFATLIATKAARVRESAGESTVMEFGLRRAQGAAANAATRAALIGGADLSSNVGMSALLGLQPSGTHAHSMVQVALALGQGELEAFRAFAEVYPDDTVLLVDTINTLESGIPNAIAVFEELRRRGHAPVGVRLDSGDLAYLSIQSARMLDAAGFPNVSIVLSNDLDELTIWQIRAQIATEAGRYGVDADALMRRLVFGVGTHLVTSWGAPALSGVYKLSALQDRGGWQPVMKLSESWEKTTNPGRKGAWRLYDARGLASADLLSLDDEDPRRSDTLLLRHPSDPTKSRSLSQATIAVEPLLEPAYEQGHAAALSPGEQLEQARARRDADVARLDPGVRRTINPHIYHVSLSEELWALKQSLVQGLRG